MTNDMHRELQFVLYENEVQRNTLPLHYIVFLKCSQLYYSGVCCFVRGFVLLLMWSCEFLYL